MAYNATSGPDVMPISIQCGDRERCRGSGADTIIGNDVANRLTGGAAMTRSMAERESIPRSIPATNRTITSRGLAMAPSQCRIFAPARPMDRYPEKHRDAQIADGTASVSDLKTYYSSGHEYFQAGR